MTPKDIEILAHGHRPMPEFTAFPEVCLYQAFANLYSRLNLGKIQRDQAKTEKNRILKTYSEMRSEYERYLSVYKEYQDNIRRAGTLLSDIEKSRDVREIALIACQCIQLMTGDAEFLKRQEVKFREED